MIRFYNLLLLGFCLLFFHTASTQTFWSGPKITFTKEANSNWALEENQDRITDEVWITRQARWSIFNIADGDISSKTQCDSPQPNGTEWAFGTIADGVENLTFDTFLGADFTMCNVGQSGSPIGKDAVLHLIEEDIYIDIKFLSWGMGGGGGGSFSYERSTDESVSTTELENGVQVTLFPNPAQEELRIIGMESVQSTEFTIFSTNGAIMKNGIFAPNETIRIDQLSKGMYYFQIGKHERLLKFVKS